MVNTRKLIIKAEKGEGWEDKGEGQKGKGKRRKAHN
jgi:hypothetical protein